MPDKNFTQAFRIDRASDFHLRDIDTADNGGLEKDKGLELLAKAQARLGALQEKLYAQGEWSVLLIFQGMDTAGKDGVIANALASVNPQGTVVHAFKAPNAQELKHDFMWRTTCRLPERGQIGVFNRSYYEEVVVVRVHPEFVQGQKIPKSLLTPRIWSDRFTDIRAFEDYLARNGTLVLKFFLHISKQEQRERLLARIDDPAKNWKFAMGDMAERKLWPRYMAAYQDLIRNTSTLGNPWYVIPADRKWFARLAVTTAIAERLEDLDLQVPKLGKPALAELKKAAEALRAESKPRKT